MGAPSGRSGVQALPNAGHSCGFFKPCNTRPLMHSGDSRRPLRRVRTSPRASNSRYGWRSRSPLEGISRYRASGGPRLQTPRQRVAAPPVALAQDRAAVLVLDFGPAAFKLRHGHGDALQQVERLETGHHDGRGSAARWARIARSPSPCRRGRPPGRPARGSWASSGWPRWPAERARAPPVWRNSRSPRAPPARRPSHWPGRWSRSPPAEDLAPGVLPGQLHAIQRQR